MAKVTLEKVSKFYGNVEAVKKIDLEITDNEFLVLVGSFRLWKIIYITNDCRFRRN
jgi:ABC-type uncharacterized transport system ATPase subunit